MSGTCRIATRFFFFFASFRAAAQDSLVRFEDKVVTLKEVVVRSDLNVPAFIRLVQQDTTFYKAFLNLRVLGYTALNDIRMFDKKGRPSASLSSRTVQHVRDSCRWMEVQSQQASGDMFDAQGGLNYYTARMYSSIFFVQDTVCGEHNIAYGAAFSTQGKTGMAKHREQLKMLFFNPGKPIPGIPFIGQKIALFEKEVAALYDFVIDMDVVRGNMCYLFRAIPRQNLTAAEKSKIVINEMSTWFDVSTLEIAARHYDLSYNAGVYRFDVHIEVEMGKVGEYLVPQVMRYNGSWDLWFRKPEKGVFTATLFDFSRNPSISR